MGRFNVILSDCPWAYGDKGVRGGTSKHYANLSMSDLFFLRVGELAAENCANFMWVTGPFMLEGIRLMRAWGFRYVNVAFVWIKKNTKADTLAWGTGHYTRANAEYVLFGLKGKLKRKSAGVHSVVMAPRLKHSSKPVEIQERIVEMFGDVPRVELFARTRCPGWEQTGLELDGVDVRDYIENESPVSGKIHLLAART